MKKNFIKNFYRKKGEEEQIPISKPRTYLSYCYELCGRLNIPFNILSFKLNDQDLDSKFDQRVRSSCVVHVKNFFNKKN